MSLLKTLSHEISTKGNIYKDGEKSESAEDLKIGIIEFKLVNTKVQTSYSRNILSKK